LLGGLVVNVRLLGEAFDEAVDAGLLGEIEAVVCGD